MPRHLLDEMERRQIVADAITRRISYYGNVSPSAADDAADEVLAALRREGWLPQPEAPEARKVGDRG